MDFLCSKSPSLSKCRLHSKRLYNSLFATAQQERKPPILWYLLLLWRQLPCVDSGPVMAKLCCLKYLNGQHLVLAGHHPVPPTAIFPPIRMTSYLQTQTPKLKPHFLRRGMSGMCMTVHKTLHLNRNICRICIHLHTFKIFASMYTVHISSNCR